MTEALTVTFKPEHAERIRAAFPNGAPEDAVKGIVMSRVESREKQEAGAISIGVLYRHNNAKRIEKLFGSMATGKGRHKLSQAVHGAFLTYLSVLENSDELKGVLEGMLADKEPE